MTFQLPPTDWHGSPYLNHYNGMVPWNTVDQQVAQSMNPATGYGAQFGRFQFSNTAPLSKTVPVGWGRYPNGGGGVITGPGPGPGQPGGPPLNPPGPNGAPGAPGPYTGPNAPNPPPTGGPATPGGPGSGPNSNGFGPKSNPAPDDGFGPYAPTNPTKSWQTFTFANPTNAWEENFNALQKLQAGLGYDFASARVANPDLVPQNTGWAKMGLSADALARAYALPGSIGMEQMRHALDAAGYDKGTTAQIMNLYTSSGGGAGDAARMLGVDENVWGQNAGGIGSGQYYVNNGVLYNSANKAVANLANTGTGSSPGVWSANSPNGGGIITSSYWGK